MSASIEPELRVRIPAEAWVPLRTATRATRAALARAGLEVLQTLLEQGEVDVLRELVKKQYRPRGPKRGPLRLA